MCFIVINNTKLYIIYIRKSKFFSFGPRYHFRVLYNLWFNINHFTFKTCLKPKYTSFFFSLVFRILNRNICVFRWCCATFGGAALAMDSGSGCTTNAAVGMSGLTSGDEFSPTTRLGTRYVSTVSNIPF